MYILNLTGTICAVLLLGVQTGKTVVTTTAQPHWDLASEIAVSRGTSPDAYSLLAQIGLQNHLPIGIALSASPELCSKPFALSSSQGMNMARFIEQFNRQFAGYRMSLSDGVLQIEARPLPSEEAKFLELRLPEFRANSGFMSQQATSLWMQIRAQIAPTEGTAFLGGRSIGSEVLPAIRADNVTVREALDRIIQQGHGGIWVVHEEKFDPHMPDPVELYGYIGEEVVIEHSLRCPVPAKEGGQGEVREEPPATQKLAGSPQRTTEAR